MMQNGGYGDAGTSPILASVILGSLDPTLGMSTGKEEVGWRVWRVWKDAAVVLILKLDNDQTDFPAYSGVFAIP